MMYLLQSIKLFYINVAIKQENADTYAKKIYFFILNKRYFTRLYAFSTTYKKHRVCIRNAHSKLDF